MGAPAWDDRLISRQQACELAAGWPVQAGIRSGIAYIDCGRCGLGLFIAGAAAKPWPFTLDALTAATVRHMVMAHDIPLNRTAGRENDGRRARAGAGTPAGDRRDRAAGRGGGADRGHAARPAGPGRRGGRAAGGDRQ
jgi:hypothetical protein